MPGPLCLRERDRILIVYEAGWGNRAGVNGYGKCGPHWGFFCSLLVHYPFFFVLISLAFAFCLHCTTQNTIIHVPAGIRTRNPSKRSAADPRLRPLCRWDRLPSLDRPACSKSLYRLSYPGPQKNLLTNKHAEHAAKRKVPEKSVTFWNVKYIRWFKENLSAWRTEACFYLLLFMCLLRGTFSPHSVFICLVWISEQTAMISLYSINWLVFITETECVYCAVRSAHSSVFMCFVWIWEQTANISLYSINWLVFITETECVYCAVRSAHTLYLCVCVDLRTNSDYFTVQH
jgi:hypothetical protein